MLNLHVTRNLLVFVCPLMFEVLHASERPRHSLNTCSAQERSSLVGRGPRSLPRRRCHRRSEPGRSLARRNARTHRCPNHSKSAETSGAIQESKMERTVCEQDKPICLFLFRLAVQMLGDCCKSFLCTNIATRCLGSEAVPAKDGP